MTEPDKKSEKKGIGGFFKNLGKKDKSPKDNKETAEPPKKAEEPEEVEKSKAPKKPAAKPAAKAAKPVAKPAKKAPAPEPEEEAAPAAEEAPVVKPAKAAPKKSCEARGKESRQVTSEGCWCETRKSGAQEGWQEIGQESSEGFGRRINSPTLSHLFFFSVHRYRFVNQPTHARAWSRPEVILHARIVNNGRRCSFRRKRTKLILNLRDRRWE